MQQLRYCLVQAKEYFDAATAVSLPTKAVQMYYCCMSLALAQILWRGTGDNSLDRMRQQHAHHGLEFSLPSKMPADFVEAATQMRARPSIQARGRFGTFEVWHRLARQFPLIGINASISTTGTEHTRVETLLAGRDERMPLVPECGLSFLDCVESTPGMAMHLGGTGARTKLVRATIGRRVQDEGNGNAQVTYQIIVHPAQRALIDQLRESIGVDPNCIGYVDVTDFPSGFRLRWTHHVPDIVYDVSAPEGFCVSPVEAFLLDNDIPLNEFGYIYVGLYICGMYARYYPDLWQREIGLSSNLSLCIEHFLEMAQERLPLLTLMDIEQTYYVPRLLRLS